MPVDRLFLAFQDALAGRYSLERELGRGGMGVVFLAREVRLDRLVAIKLLPPELLGLPGVRERFLREARTAARLSHPSIVAIHSVDEVGDFVFYVMAYVDGTTLAERVSARGRLHATEVTRVVREVAWALGYAHAQGVIHRDIKPANILIERGSDRALVTDFGIARLASADSQTNAGELLGTPEYMSPEQASGEVVDGRSDLYSLGVVGFYALTGSLPFTGTAQAVLAQHITKPAPAVGAISRGAPRALAQALDRCLAKDPAQRFASGEALAGALAPTLARSAEVPAPVRAFLDTRRNAPQLFLLSTLLPVFVLVVTNPWGDVPLWVKIFIGSVTLVAPVLLALDRLRTLARLGYGAADIAAALRAKFDERREEFLVEFGTTAGRGERAVRTVGVVALGIAALSLGLVAVLIGGSARVDPTGDGLRPIAPRARFILQHPHLWNSWHAVRPWLLAPFFIGPPWAIVGVVATVASSRSRSLRKETGSRWAKLWDGRFAAALGRIATFRLRDRAVAAERPTEMAIAMNAESLFETLPKATRIMLGDVPLVLRNLQGRAKEVREQIAGLDESIAALERDPARQSTRSKQATLLNECRQTRTAADLRLTDLVTALETLRLDLMRLQAGIGTAEGVTRDLEAADAIGRDTNRLVAARVEVERLVSREANDLGATAD